MEKNEENKKKTLILTIIGVLVLVIAVIGVSFAMYSFTGTGTVNNVIRTGTVSVSYAEASTITLTNQYPMTDAVGSAQSGANTTLQFTVSATMSGAMNIQYEVALDSISAGTTLTTSYVKFNIVKDSTTWLLSTTASTGITMASIASSNGTLITGYLLDQDTFTASGDSHTYTIKAWVADTYNLPTTDTSSGTTHSNTTTSESLTFKIKCIATQV